MALNSNINTSIAPAFHLQRCAHALVRSTVPGRRHPQVTKSIWEVRANLRHSPPPDDVDH